MALIPGPRVQGHYFDFSSVEIMLGPMGVCMNIPDISYSQKLDPGVFRGSGAKIRGRTRGTYDAEGNFTIYKEDYEALKGMLMGISKGGGYMTASFGIVVMYRELETAPIVDELRGCRITREDNTLSSGNTALTVKVNLSIMEILGNKIPAVTAAGPAGAMTGLMR